jgi:peptidoglycan hydrolase CwlO-like protein
MNNSVIKWAILPITLILAITTVVNISIIARQSDQLDDVNAQITSLEGQLSSLQSDVSELAGLADDITAIQLALNNTTSAVLTDSTIANGVAKAKSSVVAINTTFKYSFWGRYYYTGAAPAPDGFSPRTELSLPTTTS